jgi:hypothetical protein
MPFASGAMFELEHLTQLPLELRHDAQLEEQAKAIIIYKSQVTLTCI